MRLRSSSSTPNSTHSLVEGDSLASSKKQRQSSDLPQSVSTSNKKESKTKSIDIQPLFNKLQRNYLTRGKWYILQEEDCNLAQLTHSASLMALGRFESTEDGKKQFLYDTSTIPKEEIKRQEIFYEWFITEKEFVADLEMVQEVRFIIASLIQSFKN